LRNVALLFLLLVLGFPALEIYTMVAVADAIGWWLLAWLCFSVFVGWALIRNESRAVFGRVVVAMQNGQSPFAAIWDSGRTMLAGGLLIFPGVVSDVFALILLLLPNKSEKFAAQRSYDEGVVEGEVRVVATEQIESKSESQ